MAIHASTIDGDAPADRPSLRVGFVGDAGVGRTTVAALVARRLHQRSNCTVQGEAATYVPDDRSSDSSATDDCSPKRVADRVNERRTDERSPYAVSLGGGSLDEESLGEHSQDERPLGEGSPDERSLGERPLGYAWTLVDCPPGPDAFADAAASLDVAFVVATLSTLEGIEAYERVAAHNDVEPFLVANRVEEPDLERVAASESLELAEYFGTDPGVGRAMAADRPPALEDWTVEALLVSALAPDAVGRYEALEAPEAETREVVNVEVDDRDAGNALVDHFRSIGYPAAYFEVKCGVASGPETASW